MVLTGLIRETFYLQFEKKIADSDTIKKVVLMYLRVW